MNSSASFDNMNAIQKATLALQDLTSAGKLTPEQEKEFLRIAILTSELLKVIFVKPMAAPQSEINKIRFGSSILSAAVSGSAVPQAQRVKPDLSKTTLTSALAKGEVRVNDEVYEDNIEREKLGATLMQLIGEAVARDFENVAINGDTTSSDPLLVLVNGFIKQITSNPVAASNARLSKSLLRDLMKALPREFRTDRKRLAFLTSLDAQIDYVDSIASRNTPGGDSALIQGLTEARWNTIPVLPIPLFPNTLNGNQTVVILTDPKNLVVGVEREIKIEYVRDAIAGQSVYVISVRLDAKLAHEPAAAIANSVLN